MVKAWRETVTIPTYRAGEPCKNPIFLEKRVYQGSSGAVYPYPVIESISDTKEDVEYQAIYLENEYIKVMILPELGGRVQMAYDKIKQRHFIYYNSVIKPALVGLAGPWISGGIEFNWPQHHRPSTFMPVDSSIETGEDGSVTVWVSEIERMFHQKGMAGLTLRPGCAYLEIRGVLFNRTELPQTFLWWANPAVKVNDAYQSVFPPDINAVFDHGKRAVSTFPIATGTYYKMDYSAGVDISNYKNIKVPTSYMGVNSKYDFEGGYENDTKGGMLHVASHHVSPGKKQWTWGNGDFGRAWDRNLTDEDGPYIELMAGVFTENQPDFSWLMPYEEKSFVQYFMPYRELGIVKNATRDLLMNIEPCGEGAVMLKVFATSRQEVKVVLRGAEGEELFAEEVTISPEEIFEKEIVVGNEPFNGLKVKIVRNSRIVLQWQPEGDEVCKVPDAAEAPLSPAETKTVEQLYLTGLHLEQYRHATWSALDYYEEGLRRDPLDTRCNNAVGLWYLRRGQFAKAEPYFRTAVKVLQKRNPNPYEGEPLYNLALCLKYQGKIDEAYDWFYKCTWNGAWQEAGFFSCAQISTMHGRLDDALYEVDRALIRNAHNHKALALKIALLGKVGRKDEAIALVDEALKIDRFNFAALYLGCRHTDGITDYEALVDLMRTEPNNYDETALELCAAGLWQEASDLWKIAGEQEAASPMTYYYQAWALFEGGLEGGGEALDAAAAYSPDYCFPNRLEAVLALRCAISHNPLDARARYYLGCLYYDKRQYEDAISLWEASADLDGTFPTVWRNLALAYYNKRGNEGKALECMERAFQLNTDDERVLMELDQIYRRLGRSHADRLAFIQQYPELVIRRDDLVLEYVTLLNMTGEHEAAMELLDSQTFHPWEGGEGKVPAQYQFSRVELAKRALAEGDTARARGLLLECLEYPEHLGEGKLHGAQENDFYYFLGLAAKMEGNDAEAVEFWRKATEGPTEPAAAMYYNDAKPDKIFYMALAWRALGCEDKARSLFYKLITYGERHIFDTVKMDYFAVSLPDLQIWEGSLQDDNTIHCNYMMALGWYGLGNVQKALRYLDRAREMNINHQGIAGFASLFLKGGSTPFRTPGAPAL